MHIHTTDKWVLCKCLLILLCCVRNVKDITLIMCPEEISITPLTSFWLKALVGEMSRGEGSSGGGIKIHGGLAAQ